MLLTIVDFRANQLAECSHVRELGARWLGRSVGMYACNGYFTLLSVDVILVNGARSCTAPLRRRLS